VLDSHQTLIYYRAKPGVPSFNELGVNSRVRVFVAGHFLHLQGCVLSHLLRGGKGVAAGGFLLQPKYHLITIKDVELDKYQDRAHHHFQAAIYSLQAEFSPQTAYSLWSPSFTIGVVLLSLQAANQNVGEGKRRHHSLDSCWSIFLWVCVLSAELVFH